MLSAWPDRRKRARAALGGLVDERISGFGGDAAKLDVFPARVVKVSSAFVRPASVQVVPTGATTACVSGGAAIPCLSTRPRLEDGPLLSP